MVTLTQKNTVKVSREEGFKTIAQLITLELVVRRASKLDRSDSSNDLEHLIIATKIVKIFLSKI